MAYITAISGPGFGKRIELSKKIMVMGRHPDCDIVIEVGAVSRQHARIESNAEEFLLHDLKSRNGTFLNGQLIDRPTVLHDGDLIRICDVEYSFHNPTTGGSSELIIDGSTFGVTMVDDQPAIVDQREVQSSLDIRGSKHGSQLTSSAEARLKAVLEITQNLGRTVRLEEVLPKVLDTLFHVFLQADRAFIVLVDGDRLIPKWVKTRNPEQHENFRISRTVMSEVMDRKEAIISLDASSDERFELAQSIANFRIRSMVVAPLLDSSGDAIGAIQMDTLDPRRHFEQADLEILAGIAVQAGIAIENAQMHERLLEQIRVEQDLQIATQVQQAFLPACPPNFSGYQFFNYYGPADQIGGDYFDYIDLDDERLAVVVADVVGHGIAAAMLMAKLSAETRFCLANYDDLAQAMNSLNHRISALDLKRFVTLLCLKLEVNSGHVEFVNAGHMLPVWKRSRDGSVEQPGESESGIPIGVMEDFRYQSTSVDLEPGDELILYTDGITEAPDTQDRMYGIERLCQLVKSSPGDIDVLGNSIIDDVKQFSENTRQADDMCMVIIRREG